MQTRVRRSGFNTVLMLSAACVLFYAVFAFQIRVKMLFRPVAATYAASDGIVMLEAKDGTQLAVRIHRPANARQVIVYFHDNDEDIGGSLPTLSSYELKGFATACLDYRGFGLSEGNATESNAVSDAELVYDYVQRTLGFEEKSVILHGKGVGAGVAIELATRHEPKALIVESAYLSFLRLYLPLRWMPGDQFKNEKKAKRIRCPALVIHGKLDQEVPIEHGEKLAAAMPEGKVRALWIENAGHEDLSAAPTSPYWPAIQSFIRGLDQPSSD